MLDRVIVNVITGGRLSVATCMYEPSFVARRTTTATSDHITVSQCFCSERRRCRPKDLKGSGGVNHHLRLMTALSINR